MENIWLASALWAGLALIAAVMQQWVAVSVALLEIVTGAVAGNLVDLTLTPWVNYLAGFGAILLTFLAGAEIDARVIRRNFGSTMAIGIIGFLAPYLGVLAYAHFISGWSWPQAQIAGIALSTTSVAVVYAVMVETGFNQTEIGKIILAACFVNDLLTVLTQALSRVRQAARHRKKERFTALLHHLNLDTFRAAFLALKRKAAPGVDGVTWLPVAEAVEPRAGAKGCLTAKR